MYACIRTYTYTYIYIEKERGCLICYTVLFEICFLIVKRSGHY